MRIIICLIIVLLAVPCYGDCVVKLTNAQYNNLGVVSNQAKVDNPSFGGFCGTKGEMTCYGVDDPIAFKAYLDGLDIDTLKENDNTKKAMKQLRKKFKDLGFNNGDLELMGYVNDIPDA